MHPTRHNRSPLADGTREITAKDRIVARELARLARKQTLPTNNRKARS